MVLGGEKRTWSCTSLLFYHIWDPETFQVRTSAHPREALRTDGLMKVVRLQLIVLFRISHTICQTIKSVELRSSTRTTKSRVRQSSPSGAALLAFVVFRLQRYHLRMISGVLKTILKSFDCFSLGLSHHPSRPLLALVWSDSLSQIHHLGPNTPSYDLTIVQIHATSPTAQLA